MAETKVYDDKFEDLKAKLPEQYVPEEVDIIVSAYKIAAKCHEGQSRFSGEPYIMHPVAVAQILYDLGMDYESLVAALLHDVVEDTDFTLEDIASEFGEDVAKLVDGVTKLGKVKLADKKEQQAENVRKMFIAMSQDIRVIIIKLADRLHNMRTLEFMRDRKQKEKSLETLEIYAPIADRLGISSIKEELEDRAIQYLDPFGYQHIKDLIHHTEDIHPGLIEETLEGISDRVHQYLPNAEVYGRRKSVYGLYRKMYQQGKEFDEIYDTYAVRIVVDTIADCYNCLGVIHEMYHSLPGRFKDYISTPKSNMYQSLHTTVISTKGVPFEVQIRTHEMHYTAEYGIAAHWKYKLGMHSRDAKFEEQLAWIRQVMESQNDSEDVTEIVKTIKTDFVPDDVFVFTPKGDVITIPNGSTVIDFAYAIHTEVGHKMTGAKVDGRIVPLDYKVKTGEIVEVIRSTDPNKGPSRDWLKIVASASARSKIRSWFKKEKREENIQHGQVELMKAIKSSNLHFTDEQFDDILTRMYTNRGMDNREDFFAAIGYGSIIMENVLPVLREEYAKILKEKELADKPLYPTEIEPTRHRGDSEGVVVEGIENCLVKLARCCNPLPGDDIIGFITRGHGVSVHKRDCTNVPAVIADAAEPNRWITVHWGSNVKKEFLATINIYCLDKIGLLADISSALANMRVYIQALNTTPQKGGIVNMSVTVSVSGVDHLNTVIKHLKKLECVIDVERTGVS